MPSVSASQLPDLVQKTGLDVVADHYNPDKLYFPLYANVRPITSASHGSRGDKGTTLVYGATMRRRRPGQEPQQDTVIEGYAPQGAIFEDEVSMSIPDEDLADADAHNKIVRLLEGFVKQASINAGIVKDQTVANLFNKGPLTAGHTVFDGSFLDNADPYPLFIYDGKPFFATDHPLKAAPGSYSNYSASSALSGTTLDAVRIAMTTTNAIDEAGRRILQIPDVLMAPPSLESTVKTVLDSQNDPSTANNGINTQYKVLAPLINPYLTDSDSWFVGVRGAGVDVLDSGAPLVRYWRNEGAKVTFVGVSHRICAYVTNWRPWHANNIAAS